MYKNAIALFATISKAKTITTEKYAYPRLNMRMGDKYYAKSNATVCRCVLSEKTWKYRLVGRSRPIGFANNYQNADAVPAFQVNELMFYFSFKF